MDDLDKRILTAIQSDLPVAERPFDAVAARLGVGAGEVVERVGRLLAGGVIRRLGPVFDSRRLGYVSTLVAAKVPADRLEEVAETVNRLPGVTHNYARGGAYNLWFTLTERSQAALDRTLERLRGETGIADIHSLPALAVYKIRVHFDLTGHGSAHGQKRGGSGDPPRNTRDLTGDGSAHGQKRGGSGDPPRKRRGAPGPAPGPAPGAEPSAEPAALSEPQKQFIRLIQDGLPPEREPFAAIAERLAWPVAQVVEQVREWLDAGVIRRFGAVVRHRELGYRANGMAVFCSPPETIDAAGQSLAADPAVSHCYRRPALPDFPYTLFAMTHGRSEDGVRRTVAHLADAAGLTDYDVLFSVREFKKDSMRYFVGP